MANEPTPEVVLLTDINRKLDMLIGLAAIRGKEKDDQVKILTEIGLTNIDISKLIGLPKGTR